jgi:hypothetical protein
MVLKIRLPDNYRGTIFNASVNGCHVRIWATRRESEHGFYLTLDKVNKLIEFLNTAKPLLEKREQEHIAYFDQKPK